MVEIHGVFETKNTTKHQIRKYKRSGREWFSVDVYNYVRSDLMSRITKNCRDEKGRDEENKRSFMSKLGFRLHDIKMSKEESLTTKILKPFLIEKISLQHFILNY